MEKILSVEMMSVADKYTTNNFINQNDLIMKVGKTLYDNYSFDNKNILIVVGKGNNGNDGLALAYYLLKNNHKVSIYLTSDNDNYFINLVKPFNPIFVDINNDFNQYDIIVDAIFGIGLKNKLPEDMNNLIDKINNTKAYVISIDINSGLNATSGIATNAIKSDLTIAINNYKSGHFLNDAKDYIKELIVIDVGITSPNNDSYYLYETSLDDIFKPRKQNSHKGSFGNVAIMGGNVRYSGSIKLASMSLVSLICGAGLSRIIVPSCIVNMLGKYVLESTIFPIESDNCGFVYNQNDLEKAISNVNSLAFGMGLSDNYVENEKILDYILNNYSGNLLIDADGLNTLSNMDLDILNKSKAHIVLTPHIKEFSRLIKIDVNTIKQDPCKYVLEFTRKYNVILLLKGTCSLVSYKDSLYFINEGSVSLSKGGSGDILSGIICGFMAYKDILEAVLDGSYLFGYVGNICQNKYGTYASLPRDTINELKNIIKNY